MALARASVRECPFIKCGLPVVSGGRVFMAGDVWSRTGQNDAVPIGQVRVWLPDGRTRIVPLLEQPKRGAELVALGIVPHAWVVADLRMSDESDLLYDVWVEAAR